MSRQELDDIVGAEQAARRVQLVQDALVKFQEFQRAKKLFDEAAVRLVPFKHELTLVAA